MTTLRLYGTWARDLPGEPRHFRGTVVTPSLAELATGRTLTVQFDACGALHENRALGHGRYRLFRDDWVELPGWIVTGFLRQDGRCGPDAQLCGLKQNWGGEIYRATAWSEPARAASSSTARR